ncbi:MAG: hypothetical protein H0T60_20055 [Acidobacteria bacterium]|nr:hypothetical protein [Acidobacteriota bacterium]
MNLKFRIQTLALSSLLFALTACSSAPSTGGGGTASAPVAGGGAGAGAGVVSASDKPLDVMTKAIRSQLDAKSYRARMEQSASNGTNITMQVEHVSPDRDHVVMDAKTGGQNTKVEYIIVGKDTYTRMGDGPWTKSPMDMGGMLNSFRDPKVIEDLTKGAEVKFIGPDTLGGMPMLVYQYTLDNFGGVAMKSVTKTWVAVSDGMPRKSESDGEFQGTKSKTFITYSDYNADIKIELPKQ